jgi:hypothetical protein
MSAVNNSSICFWLVHLTVTAGCVFRHHKRHSSYNYSQSNYNCRVTSFKNCKCADGSTLVSVSQSIVNLSKGSQIKLDPMRKAESEMKNQPGT